MNYSVSQTSLSLINQLIENYEEECTQSLVKVIDGFIGLSKEFCNEISKEEIKKIKNFGQGILNQNILYFSKIPEIVYQSSLIVLYIFMDDIVGYQRFNPENLFNEMQKILETDNHIHLRILINFKSIELKSFDQFFIILQTLIDNFYDDKLYY